MLLSNIVMYSLPRLLLTYHNKTTYISPNTIFNAYTIIYSNYNYNNTLFNPLPQDENYDHISFATPESDFTAERIEILIQLLNKNSIPYIKIEKDKNKKI